MEGLVHPGPNSNPSQHSLLITSSPRVLPPPPGQFGPPSLLLQGHKTLFYTLFLEGLHLRPKRKRTWLLPEIMILFYGY